MAARDPIELLVALHVDRGGDTAVLVSNDGDNLHGVWIARKMIASLHLTGKTTRGTDRNGNKVTLPMANITIPEWLAIKTGLV